MERSQANAACLQGVHGGQKLSHGSRQTIAPGNDQHIAVASEFQGGSKLRGLRDVCGQDGPWRLR